MTAEDVFSQIEQDVPNSGQGLVFRRVVPESPFDVRLEVVYPGPRRRIAVAGPSAGKPEQTRGITASYSDQDRLLRIELSDLRFKPLFSALLDDFLATLAKAHIEDNPVAVLLDRISLWRRLFEELAFDGLSPEQQRGLLCELLMLQEVLIPALGPQLAISSWEAPQRAPKDFRIEQTAIEVKSRFRKGNTRVRISSEEQLQSDSADLFLAIYALDVTVQDGASLPEVVDAVSESLSASPVAQLGFCDSLVRAGYLAIHAEHYSGVKYLADSTFYRVCEGFPRLVPADLPAGVEHVAYDVDLAACAPFAVSPDALLNALKNNNG